MVYLPVYCANAPRPTFLDTNAFAGQICVSNVACVFLCGVTIKKHMKNKYINLSGTTVTFKNNVQCEN